MDSFPLRYTKEPGSKQGSIEQGRAYFSNRGSTLSIRVSFITLRVVEEIPAFAETHKNLAKIYYCNYGNSQVTLMTQEVKEDFFMWIARKSKEWLLKGCTNAKDRKKSWWDFIESEFIYTLRILISFLRFLYTVSGCHLLRQNIFFTEDGVPAFVITRRSNQMQNYLPLFEDVIKDVIEGPFKGQGESENSLYVPTALQDLLHVLRGSKYSRLDPLFVFDSPYFMTKEEKIRLLEKFAYVNDMKFLSGSSYRRFGFNGYFNNSFERVREILHGGPWDWRDSILPRTVLSDIFYFSRKENVKCVNDDDHYYTNSGSEFLRYLFNVLKHFNDTERKRAWNNRHLEREARTQEEVLDIILLVWPGLFELLRLTLIGMSVDDNICRMGVEKELQNMFLSTTPKK